MDWRNRWVAGAALLLFLLATSACGYIRHLRVELARAEGDKTTAALEAEGLRMALEAKPREVVKFVEVPKVVEKLVRERKTDPIAAVRVETGTERVDVPVCPTGESVTKGPESKADTIPLDLSLRGEVFLTYTYPEAVHVTGQLQAELRSDGWHRVVAFDPAKTDVQARVSDEILEALRRDRERPSRVALLPRPLRHWRAGWSVGVGVGYDPLDGEARPVAAAIWGAQF